MRTLAKVAIGVAVALVLAIGAVAVAVLTVDPNTLIAPAQARVKAATGRDLAVRGGARIALSLHPRVVLTDVALSNPPWASARDMVKAQRIELAFELLPLLSRRFELEEIALVGPEVNLETDASGQKSWEFKPAATPAAPDSGGPATTAAVGIGDIEIAGGTVTYRDGATGALTRATIDKLALRGRVMSSSVALDFRGVVGDVPVALAGTLGSFDSLVNRRWPFPVDVKGEVAGQKVALATKVTAQAQRYELADLALAVGASAVKGSFAVDAGGARPKVVFDLTAPALALAAVPVPALPASAPSAPPPKPVARDWVFPETPVSFAPLRWADAQGKLAIAKLTLRDGRAYDDLRLRFVVDNGRLDVPDFSVAAFGGTLAGSVAVDATRAGASSISLNVEGKGLSLGEVLTAVGRPREVKGGKTDVSLRLALRGNSPRAWASSASGTVRSVSGPATLLNPKLDVVGAWDKIGEAINPFRSRDPQTELVCAVVRFPVANGIAQVDRTIAVETSKLGVSASGTLDFRNETLDFTFQPKAKKGISIDFAGFADVVRVTGPFTSPHMAVDVAGSAKAIVSVGAAISTSGLSAVAQGLLSWADGSGPGPCQVALGAAPPQASAGVRGNAGNNPVAPITSEVGKALGKLFGK